MLGRYQIGCACVPKFGSISVYVKCFPMNLSERVFLRKWMHFVTFQFDPEYITYYLIKLSMRQIMAISHSACKPPVLNIETSTLTYICRIYGKYFASVNISAQNHCIDTEGLIYVGKVSVTQQNVQCQRWEVQHPHIHRYTDPSRFPDTTLADAANYCRAPDGRDVPWCYTTSTEQRWDHCDVEAIIEGMQQVKQFLIAPLVFARYYEFMSKPLVAHRSRPPYVVLRARWLRKSWMNCSEIWYTHW